jgi:demethylmenaquinone methyltransferase / 2-methoxy-6-polyprenyl-1,4-benzoquinol methylase
VLDVAAGTGTSSRAFTAAGADCVACDFSLGMLTVGKRRGVLNAPRGGDPGAPGGRPPGRAPLEFVAGDAMRLPFRDEAFDAVTISFGLRNVADHAAALAEFRRVTRPGGRLVVCEFGHLPWPRVNRAYEAYLAGALPAVARRLSGNPAAYEYLAESIQDWPPQPELARRIAAAGWSAVRWRDLSLGVVAIHQARRPG